jgi:hypothetical protein
VARFILFPGRHHLLTRFQAAYLRQLTEDARAHGSLPFDGSDRSKDPNRGFGTAEARPSPADALGGVGPGDDGATVVWAVTSANHQNTKRNPVAYDRREAAIERFSALEGLRSLVVPVFDTAHTDRLRSRAWRRSSGGG